MEDKKGKIMNKDDFVQNGLYTKEHYEGMLISSDIEQDGYNIGVQLDENRILVVNQAKESNVRERIQVWALQRQNIQRKYNTSNNLQK